MAKKGLSPATLKRFVRNLEYYTAACLSIRTKEASIESLKFNNAQKIVHEKLRQQYAKERRVRAIILKARQEGVSTYTAARFFRRVHLMPNQEALVIADQKDRSQIIYGIYDRFYGLLPPEIRPQVRYSSKQTQMVFDQRDDAKRADAPGLGSKISVETANDTAAGRGSTVQMVHASEMGFWLNAEEVWVSLSQAVPDRNSEVIIESTANGVGNFFHQMWVEAEQGLNGYMPIFLPWWIHEEYELIVTEEEEQHILDTLTDYEAKVMEEGISFEGEQHRLTVGHLAWRRQTIRDKLANDERKFRQEYPATSEEAFLVSGNCFFDEESLVLYQDTVHKPDIRCNLVRLGGRILMRNSERGYLKIWKRPDPDGVYVIAADTASGRQVAARHAEDQDERGGRDFSSADVFNVTTREQVAQLHGRMAPEVFAEQLSMLGVFYASKRDNARESSRVPALIAVEKNHSSGETVLRILQQDYRYHWLYRSRQMNRRTNRPTEVMGWVTNVETRMPMLDELAQAMREESIAVYNPDSLKEMRTFVRGEDGKPQAQEGCHDDRVISLAICLQVARRYSHRERQLKQRLPKPPPLPTDQSPTGLFV